MNLPHHAPWYRRIGPGLITACVVIGPGSIMTSSTVGANHGYSMIWIVIAAVFFQMTFMTLAGRLGAVGSGSPGDLIRQKSGKPLAIIVGCCVFFISAAFQSGNNVGIAAVFENFIDPEVFGEDSTLIVAALIILFNGVAISFLFAFRNLYQVVERLMMVFVAIMLLCFAVNLWTLSPDPGEVIAGIVPRPDTLDINVLGLVGTTFVVTAAFFQTYLVRQKGWTIEDVRLGAVDARVGSIVMAVITIMLMATAAAGLHTGQTVNLANPIAIAKALEPTFGATGKAIFCLGLFSAAYSSFLVNSMIGGFILSDGLGLGSSASDRWPRILTTLALLSGMLVALAAMVLKLDPTPTIIAAQAVTVVGSPLVAGVLLWLSSNREILGEHAASKQIKLFALLGFILLLAMAARTAFVTLPKKLNDYRNASVIFDEDMKHQQYVLTHENCSMSKALQPNAKFLGMLAVGRDLV
nr:Nramp family divalent metal transporter [Rubripirellula sp.]